MTMPKTLIDIDADLLDHARQILETATKKDTVNTALREIVRRHAALAFLAHAQAGAFGAPTRPNQRSLA
jgi:Arc/MetJ family transcription regulator